MHEWYDFLFYNVHCDMYKLRIDVFIDFFLDTFYTNSNKIIKEGFVMTIQEMREKKKEWGYTYAKISELSGVPVGTLQKIFRGETASPRYDTMRALEKAFVMKDHTDVMRETASYGVHKQVKYVVERMGFICYIRFWDGGSLDVCSRRNRGIDTY